MLETQRAVFINCSAEQLEELIKKSVEEAIGKYGLEHKNLHEQLNQKQAAAFLGITLPTIIEWKKRGLIPFHQIPNTRRVIYYKSELQEVARNL